jgi:two-component system, NarL family, response regulator NreC
MRKLIDDARHQRGRSSREDHVTRQAVRLSAVAPSRCRVTTTDELNCDLGAITTIVLADDHAVVRSALRMLLDAEAGLEVVAEAGDVEQTLRKVRGYKPNVLVLDLSMPGGSSLAAIPTLLEASPATAIVVLTMHDEPAFARAALRAGALGFVLKEAADTELIEAVHAAAGGHRYLNPQLGARIAAEPKAITGAPDHLTDRELEVLKLIVLDYTNTEIAHKLHLSVRTVESHRSHIHHKVPHTSRAELFEYAREHGLVE